MTMRNQFGIVGMSPLEIIRQLNAEQAAIVDLDEPQLVLPLSRPERPIPATGVKWENR